MKRRLTALLLVLVTVFGGLSASATPAAADGIVSGGIEAMCRAGAGPLLSWVDGEAERATGSSVCSKIGKAGEKKVKEAWKSVQDSVLGDVIDSGKDVAGWVLKTTITVSLMGPSVNLKATGLWPGGDKPTLAGMMTWLGLVIAAAGVMWQLGKMAVTGQAKHAGRAMVGWMENVFISALGVSFFAMMLVLGDVLADGVVKLTFEGGDEAIERIVLVLLPAGILNPVGLGVVVLVLLIIGGIQLVMMFLRQSAIPIICVLLPVAGGGRTGGETTRKWAGGLITAGLVIIAYKPMVAIILCIGFAEVGSAGTAAEWLRGCATLLLAVLAPGPLTKIFAPFGAAAGAGMSAGGAAGALAGAAGYLGGKFGGGDDGGQGGAAGASDDPVSRAQMVSQTMGPQGGGDGEGGGQGGDAQAQASRNETGASVPAQGRPGEPGADGGLGAAGQATEGTVGAGGGTAAAAGGGAAAAAGPVAAGIQVLDGVNDAVQGASGAVGGDQS
ncbi:hypothetical protein ACIQRC_34320 [Streptomyces californicus]|uniref:hypothetical protein n=1 Tax=Streptomyces californicus TaxID=67351 RepID=UPI00380CAC34